MQQTANYFDLVRPTYLENWTPRLRRLSIAQKDIPLDRDTAIVLGYFITEIGGVYFKKYINDMTVCRQQDIMDDLIVKVGMSMREFPDGIFIRLGSRSPKDSWFGHREGFRATNSRKAVMILTASSERVAEDISLALANNYLPHIFLRQWIDIEPWQEFRCFMKSGNLVGISQYNYLEDECFKEVVEHKDSIRWAIGMFFEKFKQASHLDDVVFDVIVTKRQHGNEIQWEVKLLEINPFFAMTDPCLFCWDKPGEFDGSIRIIDTGGKLTSSRDRHFHGEQYFGLLNKGN